jgi:hypothetical protein
VWSAGGSIVETHYYPGQDNGGAAIASLIDSVPGETCTPCDWIYHSERRAQVERRPKAHSDDAQQIRARAAMSRKQRFPRLGDTGVRSLLKLPTPEILEASAHARLEPRSVVACRKDGDDRHGQPTAPYLGRVRPC